MHHDEKDAGASVLSPHTFFCYRTYNAKTKKVDLLTPPTPPEEPVPQSPQPPMGNPSPMRGDASAEPLSAEPASAQAMPPPAPPTPPVMATPVRVAASMQAAPSPSTALPAALPPANMQAATQVQAGSTTSAREEVGEAAAAPPAVAAAVSGNDVAAKRSRKTVPYQDFLALQEQVKRLHEQVAAQSELVGKILGVDDRLARIEGLVASSCPASSSGASSVASSISGFSSSS
uniref:Uncharacterized protein n=2 Tax=Chrysotila carterae TaxID=13221 RepID=A0A7S4C1L9_CHRCT